MADEPLNTGAEVDAAGAVGDVVTPKPETPAFDESTIPDDVRQRYIDQGVNIGFGKAWTKAEEQYTPFQELWTRFEEGTLTKEEWEFLQGLPGIQKYLSPPKDGGEGPSPEVVRLQKRLDQIETSISSSSFQTAISTVQSTIQKRAGDDKLKADTMSRVVSQLLAGGKDDKTRASLVKQIAAMGDDKWKLIEKEAEKIAQPIIDSIKASYLDKKRQSAGKGAEGSTGIPDGPEPPESVGEFGDFEDPEFQKSVLGHF